MSVCLSSLKIQIIELKIRVVKSSKEIIHSEMSLLSFLFANFMKYKAISPFVVVLAVAGFQNVVIFRKPTIKMWSFLDGQ